MSKQYLVDGEFLEILLDYFSLTGKERTASYIENVLTGWDASEEIEAKKVLNFLEENATLRTESVGENSTLVDYWWEVAYLPEITCLEGELVSFKDYVREVMENLSEVEESSAIH
jgi:hypothetical protein